jgi:hypothetical protein
MKIKEYIQVLIGWSILQLIILTAAYLLWNRIIPGITNWPKLSFLQIVALYALYNLFKFNWVKSFKDNNLGLKIKKNEE